MCIRDRDFLPGSQVDTLEFTEVNEKLEEEGKRKATGTPIILGITKACLLYTSMLVISLQEKQLRRFRMQLFQRYLLLLN